MARLELPGGWVSLDAPKKGLNWSKWVSVRDKTYPRVVGLNTPNGVHRWSLRHVRYTTEPAGGDAWQAPADTYRLGVGDCEDIALLARAELIAMNWPRDQIWFLISYDLVARQDHAQLIVGQQFLDMRASMAMPLTSWKDYRPIQAFQDDKFVTFGRKVT